MENTSIRVAQVIGMSDGGVASVIMSLYRAIDKSKVQFDFLVESKSKIINKDEIEQLGGKVVIIPSYSNPFKYMKALKNIFKENKYDIVHSNMSTLSVFTLKAAKQAGIKVRISHSHSTANKKEWKKTLMKTLLKPFAKVYATDYFACSALAGAYLFGKKSMDKGEVYIVNNAIDLKKFAYSEEKRDMIRKQYGIGDKFVVGHIGRMQQQKNQLFLLEIFNELLKKENNAKLLLIGDGPLRSDLEKKIELLNIKDKVVLTGNVANPYHYYSAMDCFLLPSLYEGLPIVGVEAQANGLPCYFADTITKEVNISGNVEFGSINDSPAKWAENIMKKKMRSVENKLSGSKYDIYTEAKRLLKKYQEITND